MNHEATVKRIAKKLCSQAGQDANAQMGPFVHWEFYGADAERYVRTDPDLIEMEQAWRQFSGSRNRMEYWKAIFEDAEARFIAAGVGLERLARIKEISCH